MSRGGGAKTTERSIKCCCENGCVGRFKSARSSGMILIRSFFLYSPRCALSRRSKGVVIESENGFICTEVYVGFGSGDHRAKGCVGGETLGGGLFILLFGRIILAERF